MLKIKLGYRFYYKFNYGEKIKLFVCEVCGKYFYCVSRFELYKWFYFKNCDFLCLKCGWFFKYKNNLKVYFCNLKV